MRTRSQSRNQNRLNKTGPTGGLLNLLILKETFDNLPPLLTWPLMESGGGAGPPPTGRRFLPVPDLRTIEELCQPSLDGRGGPIALIAIQATTFGLKNDHDSTSAGGTFMKRRPEECYDLIENMTAHHIRWVLPLIGMSVSEFFHFLLITKIASLKIQSNENM
ncbi:hypothetical protein Tco_0011256 [Tanacetum coccineum]